MPKFIARNEGFVCQNCHREVGPVKYGGSYRNHCPFCLWSKHVDGGVPGDRVSPCQGMMEPVGVTIKSGGEYTLVHLCVKCGFQRLNRVAGDDDAGLLTRLSGEVIK